MMAVHAAETPERRHRSAEGTATISRVGGGAV